MRRHGLSIPPEEEWLPLTGISQPAVIPTSPTPRPKKEGEREFIADSPEYLAQTIERTGWRQRIDQAFQEAVKRVKNGK